MPIYRGGFVTDAEYLRLAAIEDPSVERVEAAAAAEAIEVDGQDAVQLMLEEAPIAPAATSTMTETPPPPAVPSLVSESPPPAIVEPVDGIEEARRLGAKARRRVRPTRPRGRR